MGGKNEKIMNKYIEKIFDIVLTVAFVGAIACFVFIAVDTVHFPEQRITTVRSLLLAELNNNNPEAYRYYRDVYVSEDRYIFNGPTTVRMCCQKYNLEYDDVWQDYKASKYSQFQDYFNHVLKKEVKRKNK